jgi:crotonobetainyl-CoA:carnitine CoA-transferase CaiB-like acyl-CoA transferase
MKPLAGHRVVDLTQNVAGPYCTQILADLGADVIKIERPGTGDDTRQWTPRVAAGMSPTYATLNRGKSSVAIDLDDPRGQDVLRRLLKDDDIVVHSLKPGSAERRGLGYEALSAQRPGLIYCAISAFGNVGALASLPGYDPLIQAYVGIMSVNGHDDMPPARVGLSLVDMGTGLWSALGIVAAVAQRKDTGLGTRVDTSLLETGLAWMTNPIANYSTSGNLPRRLGSATAMLAPYEAFDTADSHVFIACGNDRLFCKLAEAIDAPGMASDPRFVTNADRVKNRDLLHDTLERITRGRTTGELVVRLRHAGVPVSPVQDLSQVLCDPQVGALELHRPLAMTADDGTHVDAQAVGTPIRFNGQREFASHLSMLPGQDSASVLGMAGFTDQEITTLAGQGVIQT